MKNKNGVLLLHLALKILAPIILITNSFGGVDSFSLLEKKDRSISQQDLRAARNLEDFYWSFRRGRSKGISFNLRRFKSRKSKELSQYLPLLTLGQSVYNDIKKNQLVECPAIDRADIITTRFTAQYRKKCKRHNLNLVLAQKTLTENTKGYLKENIQEFSHYRQVTKFAKTIERLPKEDASFISDLLTQQVYKTKKLPNQKLLPYIKIDSQLTKFIQEHKLFDKKGNRYFSSEFTKLVKLFKSHYLKGDDDLAKEYLENAIVFYENNSDKIDNSKAWLLFITSGKKVARRDDFGLALDLFKISEKTADEEQIHESKFQSLFTFYRDRELQKARNFIKDEKFLDNFKGLNSKLRFWTAKIYEDSKEFKRAKELYLEQISLSPLSYYSILSLKNLRKLNPKYEVSLLVDPKSPDLNISLTEDVIQRATLFNLFRLANTKTLKDFQALELRKFSHKKYFKNIPPEQSLSLKPYFLIKFFSGKENHLHSFKVAYTNLNRGTIKLNPLVVQNLFPQKYREDIQKAAPLIEDRVILSLIRQESAFNRTARSVVGARGLMQIMPATGRQFIRNLRTKHLYKPQVNIKIGSTFLQNLLKKYEGNLVFALSAYNAGPGNVNKWQRSIPFTEDILSNIEMIPFKETRNYVKLIYRNLFFYSLIDGSTERLDHPVNNSFKVALKD